MKTVFITGASSGIGKATARYFQGKGWNVAATVRKPDSVVDLAGLENVNVYPLDVTRPETIQTAIASAIKDFGGIDVLVNNAGYGAVGSFEASSDELIQRQFDTNVFGLMRVTQALLPHFRAKRSGTIVNISSIGGRITFPLYSLYHGTKWAVEGFTESLQYELRPFGIKLRLVEPGAIKTDFYDRSMDLAEKSGLNAYDKYLDKAMPVIQAFGRNAPGPEIVARRIWSASNSKGWRLRWLVGREGALVRLRRMIPNAVFFALIRGAYKA